MEKKYHRGEKFGNVTNVIKRQINIQSVHFVTESVAKRTDGTPIAAIGGYVSSALATAKDHRPFLRLSNLLADLQGIRRRRALGRSIRLKRLQRRHKLWQRPKRSRVGQTYRLNLKPKLIHHNGLNHDGPKRLKV